ncbi:MAG TPA: ribonuclease Y [Myxococcota bacterium]|nr:ribonuclease Y [Myxococcota bacterium]HOS61385.1 ribonuclease Y [Myxococcota bacterium]HPC92619.1 ribonuclease Y [Myxococcota bacterium]HPL25924.1 ribonuclease Y [Myxococcota bacterium]HRR74763.1 ribonuclease Y [Myxococcota bacterium]
MNILIWILVPVAIILGLVAGAVIAASLLKRSYLDRIKDIEKTAAERLQEATSANKKALIDAQNQLKSAERRVKTLETELKDARSEGERREERLNKREETIERKNESMSSRESEVAKRERNITARESTINEAEKRNEALVQEASRTLQRITGMTQEEAIRYQTEKILDEVKLSAARQIKMIEDEAKEEAEKRAKRIIGIAISRYAGEFTNERTVSVVNLPSEEMKGRIIGREGRNIRAFEAATGIDVIIDDSPDTVTLSGFNPVRREIARSALEKLIQDGRIHPTRIEEIVDKATKEVEAKIKEAGEDALFQLALGSMHPELIKLVGRMKFRTSYGQNVLNHSIEVGFLAGLMAAELGLPVKEARRAGLLHDLGKAVDQEVEGPHAIVGANIARKFGESAEVVHAIASHHEEEKPLTLLAHIVTAADAMSGARPGARRESLENYVQRLQDLEAISNSFDGVERSFAIQAGREVRVMVEQGRVSDEGASMLARDIARRIEEKLSYPGQIRVCVIRETRAVDFAK